MLKQVRQIRPDETSEAEKIVLINTAAQETDLLVKEIEKADFPAVLFIICETDEWNADLSPWMADPIFRNGEAFKGKADEYLAEVTKIINDLKDQNEYKIKETIIAGYSLAGLFALYAGYRSDLFDKIVAASPSVWFKDFHDFVLNHDLNRKVSSVYLSLGDQEAKTRNLQMATVQTELEFIYSHLSCAHKKLEMNEGNHFKDPEKRLLKGITYVLNM